MFTNKIYTKLYQCTLVIIIFTSGVFPLLISAETGYIDKKLGLDTKNCKYIENSEYQLFSNIKSDFPGIEALGLKEVALPDKESVSCVHVDGSINTIFSIFFKIFIGIASVAAIINIAVAGIKTMLSETSVVQKQAWKETVKASLTGLLIALIAYTLMSTLNKRTVESSGFVLPDSLAKGVSQGQDQAAIAAVVERRLQEDALQKYRGENPSNPDLEGVGQGSGNSDGSIKMGAATIFGYKDGNGLTGSKGDNGIGRGVYSDIPGYTNYTGDPSSLGVAVPRSQMGRECGGDPKKCGYEIFNNGRSLGVFPVVDESSEKLDLSYGLVKNFIDSSVKNSNSWSGPGVSYKAIPGYYNTNRKPTNPYIRDTGVLNSTTAGQIAQKVQNGEIDVIRK